MTVEFDWTRIAIISVLTIGGILVPMILISLYVTGKIGHAKT